MLSPDTAPSFRTLKILLAFAVLSPCRSWICDRNCAAVCTSKRAGRACKPTLFVMTRLVSTIGTLVVLLLSIAVMSFWQSVGAGCRLSYLLQTITDRSLYSGDHRTLDKRRGTNFDTLSLLFRERFNSHFGRHYRTSQVEQHKNAIWPIHLVQGIYDLLN